MSGNIAIFLAEQKLQIEEEKRRLGLLQDVQESSTGFTSLNEETHIGDREAGQKILFDYAIGGYDEDKENRSKNAIRRGEDCRSEKEDKCHDKNNQHNLSQLSLTETLGLHKCLESRVEDNKNDRVDKVANYCEVPFTPNSDAGAPSRVNFSPVGGAVNKVPFPPSMRRRGEYALANSDRSLRAAPHVGVGEYELRRALFTERRRRDYLKHLAKQNTVETSVTKACDLDTIKENIKETPKGKESVSTKSVQTDIQNINTKLVQYDLRSQYFPEKEVNHHSITDELVDADFRKKNVYHVDQRLTSAQNELLVKKSQPIAMDKPKSILSNRRTGSPRAGYMQDLYPTSYTPTFMDGFSYSDPNEELERERFKRETYQMELRLQIEEKQRLQAMREEQERRERELENKRLEQQLLRMQEEQLIEEQKRARRSELMRRHSDDMMRHKNELHMQQRSWRRHADSESGGLDTLGLGASAVTPSSHYSPPMLHRAPSYTSNIPATSVFAESSSRYKPSRFQSSSYSSIFRKDTLNRMDSLNSYDTIPLRSSKKFERFDSLSRIDSLSQRLETMSVCGGLTENQRRHSATQQDLNFLQRSPRLKRRNSSSRFEDCLPIPVLKAKSPVAKELRNAVPFSSQKVHGSDALRRLEDRWQVPAIQRNVIHSYPNSPGHQNRSSILTQLGAIRTQLQREQLRMDETLRKRGLARTTSDY